MLPFDLIIEDPDDLNFILDLYNGCSHSLWRQAYKLTGSTADAADLVQSTFLIACKKVDEIRQKRVPEAYLMRIVTNSAYHELKRRHKFVDFEQFAECVLNDVSHPAARSPEELVMDEAEHEIVRDCVLNIKPIYKQYIEMAYYYKYDKEQIASLLGVKVDSLRMIRFRALSALQNKLGDLEVQ